jgi:hypothetical protein
MAVRRIVELDDKSHRREDRKRRDGFVDEALKSAGIPITRIEAGEEGVLHPGDS